MKSVSPPRKVSKDYSPVPRTKRLGPAPQTESKTPIEQVVFDSNQNVIYNDWGVMSNFDEGLRQALIGWVNTTKEGSVVLDSSGSTRSKTINFQFYGNPSNVMVGNGDIGTFSLSFKYTKSVVRTFSTVPGAFPVLKR
jgi:hypothetical protein